jgi:hypothetical protein
LGLLFIAAPVFAASTYLEAEVPFDFYVNGTLLQSGTYTIEVVIQDVLRITRDDGTVVEVFPVKAMNGESMTEHGRLVFARYGNTHFLSEMWPDTSLNGLELFPSREEKALQKDLIAAGQKPKITTVAALR